MQIYEHKFHSLQSEYKAIPVINLPDLHFPEQEHAEPVDLKGINLDENSSANLISSASVLKENIIMSKIVKACSSATAEQLFPSEDEREGSVDRKTEKKRAGKSMPSLMGEPSCKKRMTTTINPVPVVEKSTARDLFGSDSDDEEFEETKKPGRYFIKCFLVYYSTQHTHHTIDTTHGASAAVPACSGSPAPAGPDRGAPGGPGDPAVDGATRTRHRMSGSARRRMHRRRMREEAARLAAVPLADCSLHVLANG
ncbi:unnamed protein product [Plutella xylostella]|uniref:(diamondback moth) hypothetical protein n=1 Tax=Plutella xylostella TaxID=51655 RepID=A0A8S4FNI8_PLUXY|nr:unnamed protein product [Plutella xylostella]